MDPGNITHGGIGGVLGHRLLNVLSAFQLIAGGFEVQPEIEVSIEKLILLFWGFWLPGFSGFEDFLRGGFAGE